nr:transporter substrate-binding domain-containing protein [Pseudomonas akapageensis]
MLLWVLGGSMAWAASPAVTPTQIRLASEEWSDYTNKDGTGLAWDILRKVFEPAGVKVRTRSEPYSRAVGLVQRDEADAWVGSYHQERSENLYPRWPFDVDHIYALGLAGKAVPQRETIGQYRLAWVRGYEFQRYLPNIKRYDEVQRRNGIVSMLVHDHTDFYIDALTEVEYVQSMAKDPALLKSTHLAELPLYLAFANTARGRALLELFDKRMDSLVPSGELREIFERWEQPYPFAEGQQQPGQ